MRFAPLVALLLAAPLAAQTAAEHIALGDSANPFLHPDVALRHYREALALDSLNFTANWKAARAMADIAKQLEGDSTKDQRDSLYSVGRTYAERALRIDSVHAEGHYVVALVLGRLSRTRGGKERVRFARIIYDEAMRAAQIDSTLDGAWHVLGAWNAEVKRLSGFTRFFAKALFGAGFAAFSRARRGHPAVARLSPAGARASVHRRRQVFESARAADHDCDPPHRRCHGPDVQARSRQAARGDPRQERRVLGVRS